MNSSLCQAGYRINFKSFVDFAFRELHPDEQFYDGWHIELMSEILQTCHQCLDLPTPRRVIFNLPPNYTKSHTCSVSFPAWVLGCDPRLNVLIISESPEQARQLQERCAELMGTPRYRAIFERTRIKEASGELKLTYGGGIRHAGIGYSTPHRRSDVVIIDNPQSIHSLDRFRPERIVDIGRLLRQPKKGTIVLNTRRLAGDDLSAHLCNSGSGWLLLSLPVVAVRDEIWPSPSGRLHRRWEGDPLDVGYENWDDIEKHFADIGAGAFCYQYLQNQHVPETTGSRIISDVPDENGFIWQEIGTFPASVIVSDHIKRLKERFISRFEGLDLDLSRYRDLCSADAKH